MKLYHITKSEYLPRIAVEGLKTGVRHSGFCRANSIEYYLQKYDIQPIFLTKDYTVTAREQLTEDFFKGCVVLEVDAAGLELEGEYDWIETRWHLVWTTKEVAEKSTAGHKDKHYICRKNIEPTRLRMLSKNELRHIEFEC